MLAGDANSPSPPLPNGQQHASTAVGAASGAGSIGLDPEGHNCKHKGQQQSPGRLRLALKGVTIRTTSHTMAWKRRRQRRERALLPRDVWLVSSCVSFFLALPSYRTGAWGFSSVAMSIPMPRSLAKVATSPISPSLEMTGTVSSSLQRTTASYERVGTSAALPQLRINDDKLPAELFVADLAVMDSLHSTALYNVPFPPDETVSQKGLLGFDCWQEDQSVLSNANFPSTSVDILRVLLDPSTSRLWPPHQSLSPASNPCVFLTSAPAGRAVRSYRPRENTMRMHASVPPLSLNAVGSALAVDVPSRRTDGCYTRMLLYSSSAAAKSIHLAQGTEATLSRSPSHSESSALSPSVRSHLWQKLPRARGVLGFRIDEVMDQDESTVSSGVSSTRKSSSVTATGHQRPFSRRAESKQPLRLRASSSLSLSYSSRSGADPASTARPRPTSRVNSSLWKKNRVLATIPNPTHVDSAWYGPATRQELSATSPNIFSTNVLLWFPWIPTRPQIASLTLSELQQVCSDRELIPADAIMAASKAELQDKLWEWTERQQERLKRQRRARNQLGQLKSVSETAIFPTEVDPSKRTRKSSTLEPGLTPTTDRRASRPSSSSSSSSPNSLAEWARTVDLEPLLQRREAIRQQKDGSSRRGESNGPKVLPTYPEAGTGPRSTSATSDRLSTLYEKAKVADIQGNVTLSKELLIKLLDENPDDARVYRRLARLEKDQGNVAAATAVLQQGLRRHPRNAFLWHGLGQVVSSDRERKRCYHRAIQLDPTFAFPYHALGTLEHTRGQVANAMKTLKKGVYHCPTNHRLHHALGDLYRDAKMLDMAERCYRKALRHGPTVSHGFCYNALAFVAYEQGNIDKCRSWLLKSVALNNGRNANGWLSLAQLEESEGNTEGARSVCIAGVSLYEKGLLERYSASNLYSYDAAKRACSSDPQTIKSSLLEKVPTYRSGDRFHNVYRNWARLEERYGTRESAEEVYRRAMLAFPGDWRIFVDLAQYYVKLHLYESARETFVQACVRAQNRHAAPHRLYAALEMSLGNYKVARKILYRGAAALTQADDGAIGSRYGLAELYYVWAVCEWHLDEINRAEVLLEHALRLTRFGEEGGIRSMILYALARLHHFRDEDLLAQHCIGICLVENLMPGGNWEIWELWSKVASSLGNDQLAQECQAQAASTRAREESNGAVGLSRLLSLQSPTASASGLSRMKGVEMERHMRRDPWYRKIFGTDEQQQHVGLGVTLPL